QTMSIYEAKRQHWLMPGTALVLLEAQAATGFVIDPVKNLNHSVDEAVKARIIGPELHAKLLSAERAVTGYKDPYTGNTISLFQALKKDLIVKQHGIRLLEAQIATGGIIDPVNSHRLPVHVAYKQGLFDEEMNRILEDPGDDTKGFFDPNTKENLTYLELKKRCVTDPVTGLCLLKLTNGPAKRPHACIVVQTEEDFKNVTMPIPGGCLNGKSVSVWEMLHSDYFSEAQRKELIERYQRKEINMQTIMTTISTTVQVTKSETKTSITVTGLRGQVPVEELVTCQIIDGPMQAALEKGTMAVKDMIELDSVKKYLQGEGSIAGLLIHSTHEKLSIYQAMKKRLLREGTALMLLEAQAATGFLIEPVTNQKLSVDEAVKAGVVGPEMHDKLASAEKAVVGYNDPYTGDLLSLFQAMKKELIVESHGIRLLEAQIATGGIIDPHYALRLPVEVAYQRGMFDKEMNKVLSDPGDDTKGFFDPNTQDNHTYLQLKERCVTDPETGLCLLIVTDKVVKGIDVKVEVDVKQAFQQTMVSVKVGRFSNRKVTLWEIINSEYFTAEQLDQWVKEYKSGKLSKESLIEKVTQIVEEMENKTKQVVFRGLRRGVSAQQLLKSKIIDQKVLQQLKEGTTSVAEVSQLESVKQYLAGEKSIAGVFVEATKEILSIYQAMNKGLLRPGTALVLLEAQAATGFIIDPVKNLKLSVDEAVEAKVIGQDVCQKLLSAERAVTGYKDPYTGNTISLFQAMKKDLIVKEHGIRLLEAQIATGGIIDPVNSHRIPVHVAFERDMFDEEMNQILEDPSDDTKGFFDPSTQENLTYLQLQKRCYTDTVTKRSLLCLRDHRGVDKQTVNAFKKATFSVTIGKFHGETISIWECLNSEYVSQSQRMEMVLQYQSHSITLEQIITHLISFIGVRERKEGNQVTVDGLRKQIPLRELFDSQLIGREMYEAVEKGTKTVQDILQTDSVKEYLQGTGSIAGIILHPSGEKMSIYQANMKKHLMAGTALILLEAQAATGSSPTANMHPSPPAAHESGVTISAASNFLVLHPCYRRCGTEHGNGPLSAMKMMALTRTHPLDSACVLRNATLR
ncbi:plectin-like, partial [Callorhinchus milii]|uniref:plectin-like n=1 Tax=Callorhinchus milii TaxID=7868 RepID=UPI001C3F6A35